MSALQEGWKALESGSKTGWLFNYYPTTVAVTGASGEERGGSESRSALVLLFQDHMGEIFYVNFFFNPYILVSVVEGHEHEVELGLMSLFGPQVIHHIEAVEREDTDLINHLSGRSCLYHKVVFSNTQNMATVRSRLEKIVKRNASMSCDNPNLNFFDGSLADVMTKNFEEDPFSSNVTSERWFDWVRELREHDVRYDMRIGIDLGIVVGVWFDVTVREGDVQVTRCDDSAYAPAMPLICAFDIETTKAPLKFPQPEVDQIYMISYMLDGRGYLIVNREIVTDDIHTFEYTPKPEYEGVFDTFNETDEKALLRRFYDEMRKYKPNVYVTFNGDYFDFPFIHARSIFHGMNMRNEIGFSQSVNGAFLNPTIPHIDCFYWVKRDSFLPQGSQGLKAVTKAKLGYNPIEVDPEDMLPLAQTNPQQMASYSVSDALATWYLYQKYVHPFIFSLSTIIPMSPDDVLRKGSGGLCEALLMKQAYATNVVFPNKKEQQYEKFFNGHLIDTETYIGGRVEALRSGVFRSDIPLNFDNSPDRYQQLIDDLDSALKFALEVENGVAVSEVTNYDEVKNIIQEKLEYLRDHPRQQANPIIYHLDVGAMYPNIILTNRLQPYAIAKSDVCAGCCFNTPNNELQCKRPMSWKWKVELFTAGRHEFHRVKAQLENESFANSVIQQTLLSSLQKKTYGNRKGNVLEGTTFERKNVSFRQGNNSTTHSFGYRKKSSISHQDAKSAVLPTVVEDKGSDGSDSDDAEEGGKKAYHKLEEMTQFNMLKKRLGEYSRKAYGKIHETRELMQTDVVCQRENSFYVDTVRLFRDRRYEYKAALKSWKARLDAATDVDEIKLCKSRCVQMESLQLAHKCILNSFYGYVMRKGSRWYSMEMAGIVTYLGASLIQMARALVQQIGVTLELDTDGIWCCLPKTFPENFNFITSNPSHPKVSISYPCVVLNKMVHDDYSNHQYQTCVGPGKYETHSKCCIYFEVDGPYLAMLLPASREEGKSIKKRYAVFNPDGKLAELKGFELKRRGELMLIKDFQAQVFNRFLDGNSLVEAYGSAAAVADAALDMLYSKGEGYEIEEILEKLSESSNMTRRLSEYPDSQKSLALTTARRIAEFLGPQMVKDKGLACHFIISRFPSGRPVTERPIPLVIFRADRVLRAHFLRKWTGDNSISTETDLRYLLDWDYYITRFNACVQKIITIPAALQHVPNPVPRVAHPEWLYRRVQQQSSRFRQMSLKNMLVKAKGDNIAAAASGEAADKWSLQDVEDIVGEAPQRQAKATNGTEQYIDDENNCDDDDDVDHDDEEDDDDVCLLREREAASALEELRITYFAPRSTRTLDTSFFTSEALPAWLSRQRDAWRHRARLRREMADRLSDDPYTTEAAGLLTTKSGTAAGHFVDMRSKALTVTWHVMEVRSDPRDETGSVTIIAALDSTLFTFRCFVPRSVVVDAEPTAALIEGSSPLTGRILPRTRAAGTLLQVELPPGAEGERQLSELRSAREDIRAVYESHVTRVDALISRIGCCAAVDATAHVRNARQRPASMRDVFAMDELDKVSATNYLQNVSDRFLFVFHVASDTRGMIGVVNRHASAGIVVVVQPATAPAPSVQWPSLFADASRALRAGDAPPLQIATEVAADAAAAWRVVHRAIAEALAGPRPPLFAVLQSLSPTAQLVEQRALPAGLPCLCVLGAAEDERLLTDAFRWVRLLARRLTQRYAASVLWVEERVAFSRAAGIPLCNLAQDTCAHAWDVLFTRALQARGHVLWDAGDTAIAFEPVEERPRRVVMPGGQLCWCVDFSLARLVVVAVLFSQMIQEADNPNAHALCDRGVTTHFNILRDLVSDLLARAATCSVADALLGSFARWIRDPAARCYEPRLLELVSSLSHRALTTVLMRLAKVGGRTVKVSENSIVVLTPKLTLQDAVSFARYMVDSLQDQPMLLLLSLQPVRFWCPFAVLDTRDFMGLFIAAEDALHVTDKPDISLDRLSVEISLTSWGRLPQQVHTIFTQRMERALRVAAAVRREVLGDVQLDGTVGLSARGEQVIARVVKALRAAVEEVLHAELIDEVHALVERKDIYNDNEVADGEMSLTSSAVALEYTKLACRFMDLFPNDGAVGKVRNNCLRVCGVSPFSPLAQLTLDPEAQYKQLMVRCAFCNADIFMDLAARGKKFRCDRCHAPISTEAVEAHLVRRVNSLVCSYLQQDFVCSKCNDVAVGYMSQSCCGPLVGKGKPITPELQVLKKMATLHDMLWLQESIDSALKFA